MINQKHCPLCKRPAMTGCEHLAVAAEGRDFVRRCVRVSQGEKQWRALCEWRHRQGLASGEWSPEREDYTWLETAFCEEFLKRLTWFGGMEYNGAPGRSPGKPVSVCCCGRRTRSGSGGNCRMSSSGRSGEAGRRSSGALSPRFASRGRKAAVRTRCASEGWGCGRRMPATLGLMIRNVILDWSGTLVDDLPAVWGATNHVMRQAGGSGVARWINSAREFRLPYLGASTGRYTPHVPLPPTGAWFFTPLPKGPALGLEFTARTGIPGVLPEPDCAFAVEHGAARPLCSPGRPDPGFDRYLDDRYLGVWDKRTKIHEILAAHHLEPRETVFVGTCSTTLTPPTTAASFRAPC